MSEKSEQTEEVLEEENQRLEAMLENRKAMALEDSTRIAELVNVIRNYEDQNKRYRRWASCTYYHMDGFTCNKCGWNRKALDDKGDV